MTEAELALKFIDYLIETTPNPEIYKEVPIGFGVGAGVCDIIMVADKLITAVEVKTTCSLKVIEQAYLKIPYSHYSYIAVPTKKGLTSFQKEICKKLEIGIMVYWDKYQRSAIYGEMPKQQYCSILLPAKFHRRIIKPKLKDYMKQSQVAVQGGEMTLFKQSILEIEQDVARQPGIELKSLFKHNKYHWSTYSTARSCFMRYVKDGLLKQFKIKDKKVYLNN